MDREARAHRPRRTEAERAKERWMFKIDRLEFEVGEELMDLAFASFALGLSLASLAFVLAAPDSTGKAASQVAVVGAVSTALMVFFAGRRLRSAARRRELVDEIRRGRAS